MYAQVVVLTYQPPSVDSYTYEIPNKLDIKIGQLVEVPFGKRNPQGIVISCHPERLAKDLDSSPFDKLRDQNDKKVVIKKIVVKPISKIILENPIILPYQIELVKWMSAYYIAPMVNCLNAILPELPRKSLIVNSSSQQNKTINNEPSTINQSLILVPSINKIAETLAKFPKAKNHIVYHNELKASEKFVAWQRIKSGEADYIFGSRMAIFTPCPNLKEIIIYDEHDGAYKDERSPYFDTLTVAQKICELTKAQLKIVDPSPKITSYSQLPNRIKIQTFPQITKTINMHNEKNSGNHGALSFDVEEEIKEVIESAGNILLFLNKKKETGNLFCKNCKTSQFLETAPTTCPNCKSTDFFWNSLNINSLAIETKKLFPNKNIKITSDTYQLPPTNYPTSIEIGTAQALYAQQIKKYDLIAHVQTDSLLNIADYTSGEKLFAQITQLKKLLNTNGKLFLQSYNVEHPTIQAVGNSNYRKFFSAELEQRKLLSYPPYSLLIKLTIKGKSELKVKQNAEELALKFPVSSFKFQVNILGPYKSVFWKKTPTYHIILKHKIDNYTVASRTKVVDDLSKHLEKGSKNYTIEVEPDSIQ